MAMRGIGQYLKLIGRKHGGGRDLNREQAADLMGQVLDVAVSDFEIGAFCLAMRSKGETPDELAGFLDAARARITLVPLAAGAKTVVIPSYNGARKLPVLTPLLAQLLARKGFAVLLHGTATESRRIGTQEVLAAMGVAPLSSVRTVNAGEIAFIPTELLSPGLKRLLDVRRDMSLRNSAHSMVKLLNPVEEPVAASLLITSYTHPEYLEPMMQALSAAYGAAKGTATDVIGINAMILHGTEGEPVADARRAPQMDALIAGVAKRLIDASIGPLMPPAGFPLKSDLDVTVAYIESVLSGNLPIPEPIARQVQWVEKLLNKS